MNIVPVFQTRFGALSGPLKDRGNCDAAVWCSLLGIALEEFPDLGELSWQEYDDLVEEFLLDRSIKRVCFSVSEEEWVNGFHRTVENYTVIAASGKSPRYDSNHAVLLRRENESLVLAHDPHPSFDGIVGFPTHFWLLTQVVYG